ncbi:TadG family pilus assembly protein [Sphingobium bisphenolivorans]|uniref:TadG family pilus assembly protein n=1 Tax=Sphingobium bisphenolivorans TaxID=1335760 RepID=UPI00039B350C|nr:TadG family pilus assembly protein [Sphingobium bisphenolivorans]
MKLLAALRTDARAAVAPMVAMLGTALVGAAGFALDGGLYYVGSRDLRAVTDAAALSAAMNPAQALARARATLTRNGYDPAIIQSVELGRYCADGRLTAAQRFDPSLSRCTGNGQANAVRVRTQKPASRYLTRVLSAALPDLSATATAARIDEAGIGITSGMLTVSNSLVKSVNDMLGALLGIKLTLNSATIEALMRSDVDAGRFFDALARRVGESGSYADLTARTVGLQDLLLAMAEGAGNAPTAAALNLVAGQVSNGYSVPLTGLFGLGVWKDMPVGGADEQPALRAGINAYQLFAFAVQSGNGAIDLSDAVSLLGGGSTVRLAGLATGPMDRPRFSFGPAGETSVGTSALRLKLDLALTGISVLGSPVEPLSLLIDIAPARAEVSAIACPDTAEQARDTRVTAHVQSGLVNAYLGVPPANAMARPMPPISAADIGQARLVNILNLITVDARAVAQPVMGTSGDLLFGPGGQGSIGRPGAPGTPASIGNGSQTGPLLTSLIASLTAANGLQLKVGPLCLPLVCDSAGARSILLGAITAPVTGLLGTAADPLLDNLLAALGIQLGHATLWATGARCGVPVLV